MIYDKKYIDIKVALIDSVLLDITDNILDVSYSVSENNITIQFVLLKGTSICESLHKKIEDNLNDYKISIKTLFCSNETFNKNKGNWNPQAYQWLDYVLYSKSEAL